MPSHLQVRPPRSQLERIVDQWNLSYPVGTEILVYAVNPAKPNCGEPVRSKTRSIAVLLEGHTPVVAVEGRSSYHALNCVRPAEPALLDQELPPPPTYRLVTHAISGEPGIHCLRCARVSWNPNDVRQRYCGHCHEFHEPEKRNPCH